MLPIHICQKISSPMSHLKISRACYLYLIAICTKLSIITCNDYEPSCRTECNTTNVNLLKISSVHKTVFMQCWVWADWFMLCSRSQILMNINNLWGSPSMPQDNWVWPYVGVLVWASLLLGIVFLQHTVDERYDKYTCQEKIGKFKQRSKCMFLSA